MEDIEHNKRFILGLYFTQDFNKNSQPFNVLLCMEIVFASEESQRSRRNHGNKRAKTLARVN